MKSLQKQTLQHSNCWGHPSLSNAYLLATACVCFSSPETLISAKKQKREVAEESFLCSAHLGPSVDPLPDTSLQGRGAAPGLGVVPIQRAGSGGPGATGASSPPSGPEDETDDTDQLSSQSAFFEMILFPTSLLSCYSYFATIPEIPFGF